jgi:hypothetical protein
VPQYQGSRPRSNPATIPPSVRAVQYQTRIDRLTERLRFPETQINGDQVEGITALIAAYSTGTPFFSDGRRPQKDTP